MKRFRRLFGSFVGAVLNAVALSASGAEWVPVGPPAPAGADSPYVHALAVSPSYLFAGGDDGVYRSPDRGRTWQLTGPVPADPNASRSVLSLAVDAREPSIVYAGTYLGLFQSADAGETWSLVFTKQSVHTVFIDAVSPNVIYAGGGPPALGVAQLYRSADSGASWALLASTTDDSPFTAVAASSSNPNLILAGTHYGDVYRSTNGGLSWSIVSGPFYGWIRSIVFDPAQVDTVYVSHTASAGVPGTFVGGVARSRDGGMTWTELPLPLKPVGALALDPMSPSRLLASDGGIVYETRDAGETWSALNDASVRLEADAIAFDPLHPGAVYVAAGFVYAADLSNPARAPGACQFATVLCAQGGRFEVTVDFQGTPLGPSLPAHAVPVTGDSGYFWFFAPENVEVMVKVLDGRTVNGAYWVFFGALSNVAYRVTVRDTDTAEVRTYDNEWGEMTSVADTGAFPAATGSDRVRRRGLAGAWTPIGPFTVIGPGGPYPLSVYSLAVDPEAPPVVYASHEDASRSGAALSRSLDGGASWTPLLETEVAGMILVDPADSNRLYYGTARGVWSSADTGFSWRGPAGPETYALAVADGTVYSGTWKKIAKSRDLETWTELPLPESDDDDPYVTAIGVDPWESNLIFAGTSGGNLWRSENGGASWTLVWSKRDYGPTSIIVDPHDRLTVHVGTTYTGLSPMSLFQGGQYLRSVDGGRNWAESSLPSDGRAGGFDSLILDPQSNSLYAGSRGGVYRSADRGITWTRLGLEERVTSLALSGSSLYAATFDGAFSTDVSALPAPCDEFTLCLESGRFRVRASWQRSPDGPSLEATPIALTRDTGAFWFLAPGNVELVVKVLDGRPVNGHFWVFVGGLSSVRYSIEVIDTETGEAWTRDHPPGELESFADTSAFSDGSQNRRVFSVLESRP